ncbi:MAG: HNH endonuclease [Chloroflexi bacterium]|nr:HNH endonuclease [Chloroflexota bacterium]
MVKLLRHRRSGVDSSVLVLNQNYEPLNICDTRRAIVLLNRGKAEVLEHGLGILRTPTTYFPRPSVIRMVYLIKRPRPKVRLSRKEIFARDRFTCQYCGTKGKDLTIDHVIPRHRGGRHCWDNLVSACKVCNHRKGGKTLEEARMCLIRLPYEPKTSSYYILHQHLQNYAEWQKFIPEWELAAV